MEVAVLDGSVARGGSSCGGSSSHGGRGGLAAFSDPAPLPDAMNLDDHNANDTDVAGVADNDESSSKEEAETEDAR